jgi:hypothetical protein
VVSRQRYVSPAALVALLQFGRKRFVQLVTHLPHDALLRPPRSRSIRDGHPFKSSFMAMGDGRHMLPVKVETRQAIGKEVGEIVKVLLEERIRR